MGNRPSHTRFFVATLAVMLCVAGACALTGCIPSKEITQIIYEQNEAFPIDPDGQKLYVNKKDSEQQSPEMPQLENNEDEQDKDETKQDLPTYGDEENEERVDQLESDDSQDSDRDNPDKGNTDSSAGNAVSQDNDKASDDKGAKGKNGTSDTSSSTDGEGEEKGTDGKNASGDDKAGDTSGKGKKNRNNEVKLYDATETGDFPEIPENITKVTAVGDAAIIVSMLGGSADGTPLVGADEEFVRSEAVQAVLGNKGVGSVKAVWSGDGSSKGDLNDVQAVLDLDPDLCFVTEGESTFTDAQVKKLLENRILVYKIPNLDSPKEITSAVDIVGEILAKGGNEQAEKLYNDYIDWHREKVDFFIGKNGGITGGFDYSTGKKVSTGASDLYTLYLHDWDESARYSDANGGFLQSKYGVGVTRTGYANSPLSYYMSVGGVINNGADSIWTKLDYDVVAWQFSQTQAPVEWKFWSSIDRAKVTHEFSRGDDYDKSLLFSIDGKCGLGTENYPAVIVKSEDMKTHMLDDARLDNGIYHPYPLVSNSQGGTAGMRKVGYSTGGSIVSSYIGIADGASGSFLNDGTSLTLYDVYVNPCGLMGSWVDGSVESILEASWIYRQFRNPSYDVEADVRYFYEHFYDHELSSAEYKTIINEADE